MADEQDRSEALDDDKIGGDFPPDRPFAVDRGDDSEPGTAGSDARDSDPLEAERDDTWNEDEATPADRQPEVVLVDQTADADPDAHLVGTGELDDLESGDSMDGTLAERDPDEGDFVADLVPPAAEEAAMHVIPEP